MSHLELLRADCREAMPGMADRLIDAVITDPPYEFKGGFMSQSWDRTGVSFDPETWREVGRIAKPGAWLAAFGGRRTWHRMCCAIEDAGIEIRDTLLWLYTTGNVTARQTTLKPVYEPIVLAQVPARGSLRESFAEYGTGYLNVDESRIPYLDDDDLRRTLAKNPGRSDTATTGVYGTNRPQQFVNTAGRHPSNVLIDEGVGDLLGDDCRFFNCPKASRRERDAGLSIERGIARNPHTCVKPQGVMDWLCGLLTPPGGVVFDPFMGSGSTGISAVRRRFGFVGIEQDEIFHQTAELRIEHWRQQPIEV
jgi:site-specific DNA-methyltransferase (adenine-specific)